jgi:hypothetical protein
MGLEAGGAGGGGVIGGERDQGEEGDGDAQMKLPGLGGAAEEFLMMATVQNLRRLIRMRPLDIPKPCRAVPA